MRGKWILENLLGAPPPPPPPNVPPLKENARHGETPLTMRERMEEHRANPACASCHKLMDPIGFALENFDAVGAWRTREAGTPRSIASGRAARRHQGRRRRSRCGRRCCSQPELFVGTLTEKLMTYALGRGLEYYDMPAVRAIVRDAAASDYRFSSLVLGIVNSTPFQMRIKARRGEPVARLSRSRLD